MKKQFFFLVTLLMLSFTSIKAQEMYGWNLNDSSNPDDVGPCTLNIGDPTSFKILRKHDFGICAGAFAGSKYYAYTYKSVNGGSQPLAFGIYDFTTGDFTQIADYSNMSTLYYDMTYDYKNKIMYALGFDGSYSTLLKVNLNDGKYTEIATLSQQYVSIACNLNGEIFVEDSYGYLNMLDANGNETMMDGGDLFPELFFQSMTFDHDTENLYWIVPTTRGGTQIMNVDPTTGYANDYYELPNDRQIVGLDKPYSNINPLAPGEMKDVIIKSDAEGSYNVTGSMTAPATTSNGSELTSFTVHVKRGDTEIFTKTNCSASEKLTFTDVVTKDGLYTYTVYAENNEGKSEEFTLQIYLGIDIPGAVRNLYIEKDAGGNKAYISWQAPEKGLNGGYIDVASLTYDITRQPDGVKIAQGIKECSFIDTTIEKLDCYYYVVKAIGKTQGDEASTESMVLGQAHQLPYECMFSKDDMIFWNIIDRDRDNVTWKKTYLPNGISCSYTSQQGDDWIVSYPLFTKKNVKYKVVVEASCYSEELPEKMGLYFGKGMNENDLKNFVLVKDFIVTNEEGGRNTYTAYYTPDNDEPMNFAIHKHSDADMFELNVYSVKISEAQEGSVYGTVTDGKASLTGVKISLKNETAAYNTETDDNGTWSISHIAEGTYEITAVLDGYSVFKNSVDIAGNVNLKLDIILNKLQKHVIEGYVKREDGSSVPGAEIILTSETTSKKAVTESDINGRWSISVYEGSYLLEANCLGLHTFSSNVLVEKSEGTSKVSDCILKEKAVAPRCVNALVGEKGLTLNWKRPVDASADSYFQGEGVARIGIMMHTPNSIVGTVFRKDMAITKVKWQTDGYVTAHKKVDLVIFKLDKNGDPTSEIIYEQSNIKNTDNEWSCFEFDDPLIVKGGALIAFRYNGNIHMMADGGTSAGLTFTPRVHVINSDYTNKEFEYLDKHNMEKNLLIGIESLPLDKNGNIRSTIQCHEKYNVYRKAADNNVSEWTLIGNVDAQKLTYSDNTFNDIEMGYYNYAVTSVTKTEESTKAISSVIGKDLEAQITIKVNTNAGMYETHPIMYLTDSDNERVNINETAKGLWISDMLPKGIYSLHAELDGFENIDVTYDVNKKENEYTFNITFIERLLPAYNIQVNSDGTNNDYLATWNKDNFFFDDFESYEAFTIEPASVKTNWIYWDRDNEMTVEFENLYFNHMGESMSYLVFNPYVTEPDMTIIDNASAPYSGSQYLASFGNRQYANEDYIFSPILNFKGNAKLSFMIRNFVDQLGKASVNIGYTNKEYPTTEADITWIDQNVEVSDMGWTEMSYAVPDGARRMVIMNNTEKGFFLMLDDLFVGEEYPYNNVSNPKPIKDRACYEVYLDGILVSADQQKETSLILKNVSEGKHNLSITAVYKSGRSESRSIDFENTRTGISSVYNGNLIINDGNGSLFFKEKVSSWELYDVNGNLLQKGNENRINVNSYGLYIYIIKIHIGNNTFVQKVVL